jgi:hypothetical protein
MFGYTTSIQKQDWVDKESIAHKNLQLSKPVEYQSHIYEPSSLHLLARKMIKNIQRLRMIKFDNPVDDLTKIFNKKISLRSYHQIKKEILKKPIRRENFPDVADIDFYGDLFENLTTLEKIIHTYVQRFLEKAPHLKEKNFRASLRFTALVIALKVVDDLGPCNLNFFLLMKNKIPKKNIYYMEMAFLQTIDWNLQFQ